MKLKNWLLGITIFVLTMFVVVYGIQTFYESPKYEDFCGKNLYSVDTKEACENAGGNWTIVDEKAYDRNGTELTKPITYCSSPKNCDTEYDKVRETYSRNVFIITIIVGLLLVFTGTYFFSLEYVGAGLMAGGVGTLLYGAGNYWQYSANWLRFALSLIGLSLIIYLAYRFEKSHKTHKSL